MPDKRSRLSLMAARAVEALAADPEVTGDVRAVVMLSDGGDRGGMCLYGYDDDAVAMVDLICHVQALFEANGTTVSIVPLGVN